jgi:hypothetical protein
LISRLTALAETDAMSAVNMSHREGREFGLILVGELVVELGFE